MTRPREGQWVAVVTGPQAGHSGKVVNLMVQDVVAVMGQLYTRVVELEHLRDKDGQGFGP